ncbi:hypothetical protein BJ508DRAFT_350889 [Ascobolus immersus RN42]|uniref:BTB domain-containing protein n=1 Tax=Ascobolus immersus RN42 TaxID=1160509 RepID=A0A3N4HT35_ASCIM|nr:hypothetical protein BJ508DRAFT_350889 [Ascobolus immersus RN42]
MDNTSTITMPLQTPITKRPSHDEETDFRNPVKKRIRDNKTATVDKLPSISGDTYTSPIVKVYIYDPKDPTETIRASNETERRREETSACQDNNAQKSPDLLRSGVEKPFFIHRLFLERASEFFARQLRLLDSQASSLDTRTVPHEESDSTKRNTTFMVVRTNESECKKQLETESSHVVASTRSGARLTHEQEGVSTIYIASRYVPSSKVFRAFIEFAHSGDDYTHQRKPPHGEGPMTAEFHLQVYRLARSLHAEQLQKRAAKNLYRLLHSRKLIYGGPVAKLLEFSFDLRGSPDGKVASYPLTLSTDKEEMDCAQEVLLSYVVSRLSKFRESDSLLALLHKHKAVAGYIFRNASDSPGDWQEPVFPRPNDEHVG